MAEVQTADHSGEMTRRFIELVMMQAQNASFALGQIPHPDTGEAPVNLDLARLFIDQLETIRVKTRGNLGDDELAILNNAITGLQMAYVEVARELGGGASSAPVPEAVEAPAEPEAKAAAEPEPATPPPAADEGESKKKFSKSYGA